MRLHRGYATFAILLFLVEVLIALFVRDRFVRPLLGDTLAVMLVYCAFLALFPLRPVAAALLAFAVGILVELMQYGNVLTWLGLEQSQVARVLLGTTFSWGDIVAYAAGAVLALALDRAWQRRPSHTPQT